MKKTNSLLAAIFFILMSFASRQEGWKVVCVAQVVLGSIFFIISQFEKD